MAEISVRTGRQSEFKDITGQVQELVAQSGVSEGVCCLFVPHTTAGVTVNENADPDVAVDVLMMLDRTVPWEDAAYQHGEGNAAAHVKAVFVGASEAVPVTRGRLQLGTWQGIFFCEFDGPRSRRVQVRVIPADGDRVGQSPRRTP